MLVEPEIKLSLILRKGNYTALQFEHVEANEVPFAEPPIPLKVCTGSHVSSRK